MPLPTQLAHQHLCKGNMFCSCLSTICSCFAPEDSIEEIALTLRIPSISHDSNDDHDALFPLSPMAVEEIAKTTSMRNDEADEEAFGNILRAFTQHEATTSDRRRSLIQNEPLPPLKDITADTLMSSQSLGVLRSGASATIDDKQNTSRSSRTLHAGTFNAPLINAESQRNQALISIHQHQTVGDLMSERRRLKNKKIINKRSNSLTLDNKRKSEHQKKKSIKFETLKEEDEKEEFDEDEDEEFESDDEDEDEDEDHDYLQLYELIWSITHQNSTDHTAAQDVLILCYPLVTTAKSIMQCLEERFFSEDDEGLNPRLIPYSSESKRSFSNRVLSSFGVQEKVIQFIQFWIKNYWDKDWKFAPKLILRTEEFMEQIQNAYESDESIKIRYDKEEVEKVLKLVSQTDKLISNQQRRQTIILNKLLGSPHETSESYALFSHIKHKMPDFTKKKLKIIHISHIILAEQITLQTFMIYKSIHPRECLNQSWKDKKNKNIVAHNITRYINAFNRLNKWIQTCILVAENVKQRGRIIKKWVKVEEELYKLRNFQGLCAVYSALSSNAIYKLKAAWNCVAKKHITQHEMITVIMRSTGNWKNLRRLQLEAHPPMIPYFGMFGQDLIAIEETTSNRSNDGNINWNALRKVNTAIETYLIYQNKPYVNLGANAIIQRWMNKELDATDKVDVEWMFQISTHVKQKDINEIQ